MKQFSLLDQFNATQANICWLYRCALAKLFDNKHPNIQLELNI